LVGLGVVLRNTDLVAVIKLEHGLGKDSTKHQESQE
jgi:hypothetical protein